MQIPDLPVPQLRAVEHLFHALWLDDLIQRLAAPGRAVGAPSEAVRARIAVAAEQRTAAEDLVRRRYAWRGYRIGSGRADGHGAGAASAEHLVTILAEGGCGLVGTLTVRPDAPGGLLAEATYGREIEALREGGSRVGELTRLALEKGADWREALDALVQAAWTIARLVHKLTDVVIEVNPRHVRFYERVFGFVQLASGGVCGRVGAPSVLLRLELAAFASRMPAARLAA